MVAGIGGGSSCGSHAVVGVIWVIVPLGGAYKGQIIWVGYVAWGSIFGVVPIRGFHWDLELDSGAVDNIFTCFWA